jgi:hypothetical protein
MNFFKQKNLSLVVVFAVALAFCGATSVGADEAGGPAGPPAASAQQLADLNKQLTGKLSSLEKKIAQLEGRLSKAESRPAAKVMAAPMEDGVMRVSGGDINVTGFIDTSLNWNFQNPEPLPDGNSTLRAFDRNSNTFELNNIQIEMARPAPEDGGVGFRTVFMYGTDAQVAESTGFLGGEDEFSIQQGYLDINLPQIGNGLTVLVGKFATLQGAEVIENHLNWNSSRGLLFNNAIPFTHTGVRALYDFMDGEITTALGLVNGWDNALDNNDVKDIEARVGWNPSDTFSTSVGFMVGSQQDGDRENQRGIVDVIANWTPFPEDHPNFDVMLNYDYGWEEDLDGRSSTEDWQGFAAYAKYGLYDWLTFAARFEYFFDEDGVRTGIGRYNALWEMTYTADIQMYDNLLTRLEYRHDQSNAEDNFDGGTSGHQTTVSASMIYLFG